MQSLENKIFAIIKGNGRGYVFSASDFNLVMGPNVNMRSLVIN